jgi:hypothetical protein
MDPPIAYNCVPCRDSCLHCLGDYTRIFPKVRCLGVQHLLLGILVGQHPIQVWWAVDDALVTAMQPYTSLSIGIYPQCAHI